MPNTHTYSRAMGFKENLRRLMDERQISQNALAEATKVPQPTIHRILTGESKEPRGSTLATLAAYFGQSVQQMQDGESEDLFSGLDPESVQKVHELLADFRRLQAEGQSAKLKEFLDAIRVLTSSGLPK